MSDQDKYPKLQVTPADGDSRPEEVSFEYKADFQGKGRFYTDSTNQAKRINDLAELDDNWIVVGYHLCSRLSRDFERSCVSLRRRCGCG